MPTSENGHDLKRVLHQYFDACHRRLSKRYALCGRSSGGYWRAFHREIGFTRFALQDSFI